MMPSSCDGCGSQFSLSHVLDCRKGGLITQHHNEVRDALDDLVTLAYRDVIREPIVQEGGDYVPALIVDLGIRIVWLLQIKALCYVRVTDEDVPSYMSHSVAVVLVAAEEKEKHLTAAKVYHTTFSSFVVTVDEELGHDIVVILCSLAERLPSCWDKSFGVVFGWIILCCD